MSAFKTIDISKLLYELLRNYLSVNKVIVLEDGTQIGGEITLFYRFLLSGLYPYQSIFDAFHEWRKVKKLIAYCNWEIGQATNLLNYLFDSVQNRITITQTAMANVFVPSMSSGESTILVPSMASGESSVLVPSMENQFVVRSIVTVNVPTEIYNDSGILLSLTSVIDQIILQGLTYQITEL